MFIIDKLDVVVVGDEESLNLAPVVLLPLVLDAVVPFPLSVVLL